MGVACLNFVEKTFAGGCKITKFVKVFSLESFPLYGTSPVHSHSHAHLHYHHIQTPTQLRQTLYHVYVVDTSVNKEWEHWQPKLKNGKSADIDTSPQSLTIQEQAFPCVEGYCWVDMSVLIQECYNLVSTS